MNASGGDQEGERKRTTVEASKHLDDIKTGESKSSREKSGGYPVYWPGGVRREGGASLVCCSCTERGKAGADTTGVLLGW